MPDTFRPSYHSPGTFGFAPAERVVVRFSCRVTTALRAGSDAAYVLGLDHEIGSIQAGKKADFSIFEEDPTTVPVERLETLTAWGVVFEGKVRQAARGQ